MTSRRLVSRRWRSVGLIALALSSVFVLAAGIYYRLGPFAFLKQAARVAVTPIAALLGSEDVRDAEQAVASYYVGTVDPSGVSPGESWTKIEQRVPGFRLDEKSVLPAPQAGIPFVYQKGSAEYLRKFRETYRLDEVVAGAPDEYEAMLRLGGWLGSQWDHGLDVLPNDSQVCDPVAVIERGRAGAKYWCEVAARTLVHASSALGWEARLITGSSDGYTWEHAVAEIWSNRFDKWFVIDADLNVVYEEGGVPLSAFELHSRGLALRTDGRLKVRRIAPPKPSLPRADVLPLYSYIHIDMRSDWCTRKLSRGSPVGGDRATWWAAHEPLRSHLLTAKIRVDDEARFDWRLNNVALYAGEPKVSAEGAALTVNLFAYSPQFAGFQVRKDDLEWQDLPGHSMLLPLEPGDHSLSVRARLVSGATGPESRVGYSFQANALRSAR